jgi:hypothetical protein
MGLCASLFICLAVQAAHAAQGSTLNGGSVSCALLDWAVWAVHAAQAVYCIEAAQAVFF